MKKILSKLFLVGICAATVSGCSLQDLFNKKSKNNDNQDTQEPTHEHTFSEVVLEKPATCTEDGFKAHFTCTECGKYFDVSKREVSKDSLVIEKLGHLPGSTWYESEGYHYHICERCSHKVDVAKHNLHEVAAHNPNHEEEGTFAHYECDICNKKFLDSYGLVEIDHTSAVATGHDEDLTYHPEVPATCESDGTKAYYSCSCGALFEDAQGTKSIENPINIPALGHIHNGVWKSDGNKHWHECFRCHEIFDEHVHTPGNETYQDLTHSWKLCSECHHKVDIQDLVITGCHHDRLAHYERLQPTTTVPGHIEFYYCFDCDKCFYGPNCTQEIPNTEYGVKDKRDGRYLSPLTTSFCILNQNLRDYMDAETDQEIIAALGNNSVFNYQANKTINWEDNLRSPYSVEVSTTRDFATFKSYSSNINSFTFEGLLMPGETYYYRIKDSYNSIIVDDLSFKVKDNYFLRPLTIDNVSNVRDLGGWTAKDGNKVLYGKLFRGGELKVITEKGKRQYLQDLGIKTEIDLRGDNPQHVIDVPELSYRNYPVWMYTSIIPGISISYPNGPTFNFESYSIASIKSICETLADSNNYPIYYHCSAGADRTGTISYLISGLLGVEYSDLCKDFELTSFSIFGDRYRSTPNEDDTWSTCGYYANKDGNWMGFGKMNDIISAMYGEDGKPLYVAIENYLKEACEISDETIANVRRNLLGQDVDFTI